MNGLGLLKLPCVGSLATSDSFILMSLRKDRGRKESLRAARGSICCESSDELLHAGAVNSKTGNSGTLKLSRSTKNNAER